MPKISLLEVLALELCLKHVTACETGPTAEWTVLSQSIYPYLAKKKKSESIPIFFHRKKYKMDFGKIGNLDEKSSIFVI